MAEPLSDSQQRLRGKDVRTMTNEQLVDWIHACNAMEKWVSHNKARRGWKQGRADAEAEIQKREDKAKRQSEPSGNSN
jgi:hypothetical protein